jgi:L-fuconolactonase
LRIDSHVHFTAQHPCEHLTPILRRNRFEGAVVVGEPHAAREEGDLPYWEAAAVDLGDPRLGDRLDEYQREPGFRGVWHRLGEGIPEGLGELARRGIPLDLSLTPRQLPRVARIAERLPTLRIAMDHLAHEAGQVGNPGIFEEWARAMEEAAGAAQVFCKISGLLSGSVAPWKADTFRPWVQHALAVFGPERLMFGSGWPGCLPAAGWKETLAAFTQSIGAQTMDVREQLLGGTACRFYGIEPGDAATVL